MINPSLVVLLGNFNAKSSACCDKDKATYIGSKIDTITLQYKPHQLINEPTHILECSSSCIDLIFTFQPNLFKELGSYDSLHGNYHHQLVNSILKFIISLYTNEECDITEKQKLIKLEKQSINLTGKNPLY